MGMKLLKFEPAGNPGKEIIKSIDPLHEDIDLCLLVYTRVDSEEIFTAWTADRYISLLGLLDVAKDDILERMKA